MVLKYIKIKIKIVCTSWERTILCKKKEGLFPLPPLIYEKGFYFFIFIFMFWLNYFLYSSTNCDWKIVKWNKILRKKKEKKWKWDNRKFFLRGLQFLYICDVLFQWKMLDLTTYPIYIAMYRQWCWYSG